MSVEWNTENAAHLLRRAAFAAPPERIDAAVAAGMDATIDELLGPDEVDDSLPPFVKDQSRLQGWWIERIATSPVPLREKLALEWHNFFATGMKKVKRVSLMHRQNQSFRGLGAKNFEQLLRALAKDPALLIWLNQVNSVKGNPNENLARELMELFSTGVFDKNGKPNYNERDVSEAARALTGFTTKNKTTFWFDASIHDGGVKTVKGVTGHLDGDDVLDIVLADPATHRRVAQKLWSWFAFAVELDHPVLDGLEATYRAENGALRPMLREIFRSETFCAPEAKRALVRSHAEFFGAALRCLGATIRPGARSLSRLGRAIEWCGQPLFNPPSVFGWPGGSSWLESSGLLGRARCAAWIADARADDAHHPVIWDPASMLPDPAEWPAMTAEQVVDRVIARLGPLDARPSTVLALVTYLQTDVHGDPAPFVLSPASVEGKFRGLVALALSCPEFQFA